MRDTLRNICSAKETGKTRKGFLEAYLDTIWATGITGTAACCEDFQCSG